MFDSIYLKFNSKQSSTRDLAKGILHLFKYLSLVKGFYQQTSLMIMYYITPLAKFGNCCGMVWVHRQSQWKGKHFTLSFSEQAAKKLCNVFSDVIFYPRILQQLQVLKTIPAPACLVALMIWHSCYRAQTLKSEFRKYICLIINFCHQHRNINSLNRHKMASFLSR